MAVPDPANPPVQPASLAADRLQRAIEQEIVPRLLLSHAVGPLPPQLVCALTERLTEEEVARFIDLLRGDDEDAAQRFSAELCERGMDSETIYLDLLTPAARALGTMWEQDQCDFVEVTVALGRLQRVLRSLSHVAIPADATSGAGAILLATMPGEQHSLGLFMVAEFFVRSGWAVAVGAPLSTPGEIDDLLAHEWFDVIGYSVACDASLPALKREIRRVRRVSRNKGLRVIVGGRVFNDQPALVGRVGADGTALDGKAAPGVAQRLL